MGWGIGAVFIIVLICVIFIIFYPKGITKLGDLFMRHFIEAVKEEEEEEKEDGI